MTLPCADRSLSSTITRSNSVLLTANLRDGSFFLSRVVHVDPCTHFRKETAIKGDDVAAVAAFHDDVQVDHETLLVHRIERVVNTLTSGKSHKRGTI